MFYKLQQVSVICMSSSLISWWLWKEPVFDELHVTQSPWILPPHCHFLAYTACHPWWQHPLRCHSSHRRYHPTCRPLSIQRRPLCHPAHFRKPHCVCIMAGSSSCQILHPQAISARVSSRSEWLLVAVETLIPAQMKSVLHWLIVGDVQWLQQLHKAPRNDDQIGVVLLQLWLDGWHPVVMEGVQNQHVHLQETAWTSRPFLLNEHRLEPHVETECLL